MELIVVRLSQELGVAGRLVKVVSWFLEGHPERDLVLQAARVMVAAHLLQLLVEGLCSACACLYQYD